MKIMGFTDREMVVLNGGGHAIGQCHHLRSGFQGPWTPNPSEFSNSFFRVLLERTWEETTVPQTGKKQLHDKETGLLTMLFSDLLFRDDPKFHAIVEEYAQDNDLFLEDFRKAWVKLVNADRFGDVCVTSVTTTTTSSPSTMKPGASMPDGNMQIVEPASGPVTVNCNSEPGKNETSTVAWTFITVLALTVFALIALVYMLARDMLMKTRVGGISELPDTLSMKKSESWKVEMQEVASDGGGAF